MDLVREDSPEEICSAMETGMEVVRFVANLSPPLKKALLLREEEGMSYDEIAIKMECPMGTVRSRIHRARAEIRKILEKDQ
ncbi:sigma-70 family RNA polymerase sigma factor [Janthinobacterium sp. EB271-G4-3-2]|uniref:sigma-70 family RNA polymerase sigma factor n=1 Tax=Janthinobacterium sp. EB271-G4-3-2 TaxID=2775058 RepID=UPI002E796340|nr:sigma-70 family RNA polymerase sigma factor [Janthinobacterium sp. EB271-G4-3-2]